MEEYLGTGMVSIAAHTIVLPASYLLNPSLTNCKIKTGEYETVTKLLMLIPRLLNDIQSYQVTTTEPYKDKLDSFFFLNIYGIINNV